MSERGDDGMSPVIGAILLIAISVALVAITGAVVVGVANTPEPKLIALTVTANDQLTNTTPLLYYPVISVTIYGGEHVHELRYINVSLEGASGVYFTGTNKNDKNQGIRKSSGFGHEMMPLSIIGIPLNYVPLPLPGPTEDEYSSEFLNKTYDSDALVTVTGTFSDGSIQTLYSKRMKINPSPEGRQQRMNSATKNVADDPYYYWQSPVFV